MEHSLMDSTRSLEVSKTRFFWPWICGIMVTVGIVTVTAGKTLVSSWSFERRYQEGSLGLVRHRRIPNHSVAGGETSTIRSINSSGSQDTGEMQLRRRMDATFNLSREGIEVCDELLLGVTFSSYERDTGKIDKQRGNAGDRDPINPRPRVGTFHIAHRHCS